MSHLSGWAVITWAGTFDSAAETKGQRLCPQTAGQAIAPTAKPS